MPSILSSSPGVDVTIRRTGDLTPAEIEQFRALFESVFHRPFPRDLFGRKYGQAATGASFHALLKRDGAIVGAYNAIPLLYDVQGERHLFAIPADLMIHPDLRPAASAVERLMQSLYEELESAGVEFIFALVRESIFPLHKRFGGWERIGSACYYAAVPRHSLAARALISCMPRNAQVASAPPASIRRVRCESRYRVFPCRYGRITLANGESVVYVRKPYYEIDGVPRWLRVAYILDAPTPGGPSLDEFLGRVSEQERDLHCVFYMGWPDLQSRDFRRLPARFQRPSWCAGGRILRRGALGAELFDARNWNLSLGDTDLL